MALKMRATGLSSPVDEHLTDFTDLTGEWVIGRIYAVRGSPPGSSLVLVAASQWSDEALESRRFARGGQGPAQDQLGSMEGLGKPGGAGLGGTLMSPTKLCERVSSKGSKRSAVRREAEEDLGSVRTSAQAVENSS
jgi:hypothetical protein